MTVTVTNAQRQAPVPLRRVERLARRAARALRIRARGALPITFISAQRMRRLNHQALRHNWATDVLTFRYEGEPIVGEILIAPALARTYAKGHGIPYEDELGRYVVHGLLHWLGHEDATPAQQRRMRALEDRLLTYCGRKLRVGGSGLGAIAHSPEPRARS